MDEETTYTEEGFEIILIHAWTIGQGSKNLDHGIDNKEQSDELTRRRIQARRSNRQRRNGRESRPRKCSEMVVMVMHFF